MEPFNRYKREVLIKPHAYVEATVHDASGDTCLVWLDGRRGHLGQENSQRYIITRPLMGHGAVELDLFQVFHYIKDLHRRIEELEEQNVSGQMK